jgi:hypothetical protein
VQTITDTRAAVFSSRQLGGLVAQFSQPDGPTVRAIAAPAGSYRVETREPGHDFAPLPLTTAQARAVFDHIQSLA